MPHFYLNIEIDGGPLVLARAELKSAGEGADASRITVNDLVLKAAVDAAVKVPKVNASFDDGAIVQFDDVDLAVAVAIEDGLVTPVIRAAQTKSLREISETVRDFAYRARNKRMKPDEFQGGTFTVSNLGGYSIDNFSAIINPPQGFILSIGALTRKPVTENPDRIVVGHRMSIGMSCDHRIIDGALGAKYPQRAPPFPRKSSAALGLERLELQFCGREFRQTSALSRNQEERPVSHVMKSSRSCRVRLTANARTVASSRKPIPGIASGITSSGFTT